jgi:hypothetical protein
LNKQKNYFFKKLFFISEHKILKKKYFSLFFQWFSTLNSQYDTATENLSLGKLAVGWAWHKLNTRAKGK